MAQAPGHRLGQIIGDALELSMQPMLQGFADEHSFYLDRKGSRLSRPKRRKCTWIDALGNAHDLDFVLERGGTDGKVGEPVAFIETAWRRYTKHSRNKAQEIQGALLPLLEKYSNLKPFAGVVVAGHMTSGAIEQLKTSGFSVLHIPYDEIVEVFAQFGIDVDFKEDTSDEYQRAQVDKWDHLSEERRSAIGAAIRNCAPDPFEKFKAELEDSVSRSVKSVRILALHGVPQECNSIEEAIAIINSYHPATPPPVRFEVEVRYTNGDHVQAEFRSAADAEAVLPKYSIEPRDDGPTLRSR